VTEARNSVEVGANRARMARSSECVARRRIVGEGNSATRRTDSRGSSATPARLKANDEKKKIVGEDNSATSRTESSGDHQSLN